MIRESWRKRILVDILIWILAATLCTLWRWVSDKSSIGTYWALFGVLVVLWMAANFIGEELTSEAAEIRRDIKRLVKETKQHEMKAREGVREKMRGTYAMYNKKAARCGRT